MDDVDALLDSAFDTLMEQDRQKKVEKEVREEKLNAEINKALEATSQSEGPDMEALRAMLASMGNGAPATDANGDVSMDSINGLMSLAQGLVQALEGAELSNEDQQTVSTFKNLMSAIENDDEDKANELVQNLSSQPGVASSGGPGDDLSTEKIAETLQELLRGTPEAVPSNGTQTTEAASSSPLTTADPSLPNNEEFAKLLANLLSDGELGKTMAMQLTAYDAWLVAHTSDISAERRTTVEQQRAKVADIVEFLSVPVNKEDEERIIQLMEMMYEYSRLGDPPEDLIQAVDPAATAAA